VLLDWVRDRLFRKNNFKILEEEQNEFSFLNFEIHFKIFMEDKKASDRTYYIFYKDEEWGINFLNFLYEHYFNKEKIVCRLETAIVFKDMSSIVVVPAKTDMIRGRRNLKVFLQGTVSRDFYDYISLVSDFIRWVGDDFEAFLENNMELFDREFSDLT
jgi:hypothetical protein